MSAAPHPDRFAITLADRAVLLSKATGDTQYLQPGAGSADARMDLKLWIHRAQQALRDRGNDAAHQRLRDLQSPDLWAGTVQDGVARGFQVALEEAMSLCSKPNAETNANDPLQPDVLHTKTLTGKELRRTREFLVASGGARIRFSRKQGVQLIDRARDLNVTDCIRFEDRADRGTLDAFMADPDSRPRLFSPAFLQPVLYESSKTASCLVLQGRLGRGPGGHECRLTWRGCSEESAVRMQILVHNRQTGHRLRIRFLGIPDNVVHHAAPPTWERVAYKGRHFLAATLVRAVGTLCVGEQVVDVPSAQCLTKLEHEFQLGG